MHDDNMKIGKALKRREREEFWECNKWWQAGKRVQLSKHRQRQSQQCKGNGGKGRMCQNKCCNCVVNSGKV